MSGCTYNMLKMYIQYDRKSVVVCACGCMGICACGCMEICAHGCMEICAHGCMEIYVHVGV